MHLFQRSIEHKGQYIFCRMMSGQLEQNISGYLHDIAHVHTVLYTYIHIWNGWNENTRMELLNQILVNCFIPFFSVSQVLV